MFGNEMAMRKDTIFAGGLVLASILWLGAGVTHEALATRAPSIALASHHAITQVATEATHTAI